MQKIGFVLLRILSILPFWVLYRIADLLFCFLYYIIQYRIRVVQKNIRCSFPEKTEKEQRAYIRGFYRFLSDYFMETIKLQSISNYQMRKHMQMKGVEGIEKSLKEHDYCFVLLGHYGNWEWISSLPLWIKESEVKTAQLYRPLNNKQSDRFFLNLRERFGSVGISKYDAYKQILKLKEQAKGVIVGFVADQAPGRLSTQLWTTFMHQETNVFTGAERIGKKINACFYFAEVVRLKRGYYQVNFQLIDDKKIGTTENSVTLEYIKLLEKMITREPCLWLWSHNRWKHKRENEAVV